MKDKFINLLKQVRREGIPDLIRFLETSDFFTAPAKYRGEVLHQVAHGFL
jgi:hypothetical protein